MSGLSAFKRDLIRRAVLHVGARIESDRRHAKAWQSLRERDLWRELVTCILGSRVEFRIARAGTERLEADGLLKLDSDVWGRAAFLRRLRSSLSRRPLVHPFATQRATYIRDSALELYGRGNTLRRVLSNSRDATRTRRSLVDSLPGIGPKQASLFLNSIGYTEELAVFDTHSMTYMRWNGLLSERTPPIGRVSYYEGLERVFAEHAHDLGLAPSVLDTAAWIVVRVAKELQAV